MIENMVNSSRGRPRGGSDARERLITEARLLFFERGYTQVSARAVARAADVDHAMVNYYFGSKQGLFAEVMALELSPTSAVEQVLRYARGKTPLRIAEELVVAILGVWEHERRRLGLLDVVESVVADPATRSVMGDFISAEVLARMREHIGGPDAAYRAAGVSTVISGLIFARYLLRVEPLASMPPRDVVRTMAPMVALQLRA